MAAFAGRDLRIKYDSGGGGGAAVVAGARTDSMSIANTPIDITDKDDEGVITLLDDIGTKQFSLTVSGVLKNATLITLADSATAGAALHDFEIEVGTGTPLRTYTGSFFIASFEVTGEQQDTATFTMTLNSSGAVAAS